MLCKMLIPIFLSGFLAAQQPPVHAQRSAHHPRSWERLKSWANEYPVTPAGWGTRKVDIFKDVELHRDLLNLLGKANYNRLMEDFGKLQPIDLIRGHLVLQGVTNPHLTPRHEFALVILHLADTKIWVVFYSENQVQWYSAEQGGPDLPLCILDRIQAGEPF